MTWQAGSGLGRTITDAPADTWRDAYDRGALTERPEVASLTVPELAEYATDESNPFAYRVAAQDELSRRAHYEEDGAALSALLGRVWP